MTCEHAQHAIRCGPDLDDATGLHIDGCATCRMVFDRTYEPIRIDVGPDAAARRDDAIPTNRRWWPIPIAFTAIAMAVLLWISLPSTSEQVDPTVPFAAADISHASLLSGPGSAHYARFTVVVFWEVWCDHCAPALRELQRLWARSNSGITLVGVTTLGHKTTPEAARAYVAEHEVQFPTLVDSDRELTTAFGVHSWPIAAFVDDGQVTWMGHPSTLTAEHMSELQR